MGIYDIQMLSHYPQNPHRWAAEPRQVLFFSVIFGFALLGAEKAGQEQSMVMLMVINGY